MILDLTAPPEALLFVEGHPVLVVKSMEGGQKAGCFIPPLMLTSLCSSYLKFVVVA